MVNLAVVIALISLVCVSANPVPQEDEVQNTATAVSGPGQVPPGFGNWPAFLKSNFNFQWPQWAQTFSPEGIANLKPGPGGYVHGVSASINSHTEWKNGKPVVSSEGHYAINKNGVVETGSFPDSTADNSDKVETLQ